MMVESGRGQEVITHLPALPEERGALASPFKNLRAVSIAFYFQDFTTRLYVLHCLFRSFDSIFYITGLVLTELGETCKERGWLPIASLAECKASTEYIQRYGNIPSYYIGRRVDESYYPKGCFVVYTAGYAQGYFNTHDSGDSNSDSRALCTRP